MKKVLLTIALFAGALNGIAQPNPNANPLVTGITSDLNSIEVGQATTVTFEFGNNGSHPVLAGGAEWVVSFPATVNVNTASLQLTPSNGLVASWNSVLGSGMSLTISVAGSGISPMTFIQGTVQVTGAAVGGPDPMTIEVLAGASMGPNANTGDDDALSPIQVLPADVLPIDLLSFTGRLGAGSTAHLNWKVAHPDHFSHFELERSVNGNTFTRVASVKLTDALEYQQDDNLAGISGNVQYRLRMVDLDGIFRVSGIVSISLDNVAGSLSLYPNPATTKVAVKGLGGDATYTLHTLNGRKVQNGTLSAGNPEIAVSALAAGSYLLNVTEGGRSYTLKMVRK